MGITTSKTERGRPSIACSCSPVGDSVSASAADSEYPSTFISGDIDVKISVAVEGKLVANALEALTDAHAEVTQQEDKKSTNTLVISEDLPLKSKDGLPIGTSCAAVDLVPQDKTQGTLSLDESIRETTNASVENVTAKTFSTKSLVLEPPPQIVEALPQKKAVTTRTSQTRNLAVPEVAPKGTKSNREKKKKEPQQKQKMSHLQRIREQKKEYEAKKEEMGKLVDDIVAGKYKKNGGGQPAGNMLIKMPTPADRANTRIMILEGFRAQYSKIGKNNNCPSAPASSQYSVAEQQGLKIEGGHRSMPRPTDIKMPKDFRKPVGQINLKTLSTYNCENSRILVSVYGDVFDVSDRPDKYALDGPYSWMSGHDITWGFVSGKDVPETIDHCYDLWKVAPEPFRDGKLKLIYAWVAFYEFEYGGSVGRLDLYDNEAALKGPPMEESEDCCIM